MKKNRRLFPSPWQGHTLLFFLLMPLAYLFFSLAGLAAPPKVFVLDNLALTPENDELIFSCSISVDDEEGLRDLLKDGAVLELTIELVLERHRSWWLNADTVDQVYTLGLRHDPLTRNFLTSLPEHGQTTVMRDKNLTRLLHASWRHLKLPVIPIELLREEGSDNRYLLTATFRLQHTEIPPWLEKSSVFWSSDVVSRESRTLEYQY